MTFWTCLFLTIGVVYLTGQLIRLWNIQHEAQAVAHTGLYQLSVLIKDRRPYPGMQCPMQNSQLPAFLFFKPLQQLFFDIFFVCQENIHTTDRHHRR